MSLQDRLDALKADFEGGRLAYKPSPDVLDTMHRATAELIASGQALNAKKAGDTVGAPLLDGFGVGLVGPEERSQEQDEEKGTERHAGEVGTRNRKRKSRKSRGDKVGGTRCPQRVDLGIHERTR